jgi:hypothetical protein
MLSYIAIAYKLYYLAQNLVKNPVCGCCAYAVACAVALVQQMFYNIPD